MMLRLARRSLLAVTILIALGLMVFGFPRFTGAGIASSLPEAPSGAKAPVLGMRSRSGHIGIWLEAQPQLTDSGNISAEVFLGNGGSQVRIGEGALNPDRPGDVIDWVSEDKAVVFGRYLVDSTSGTTEALESGCLGFQAYDVSPDGSRIAYFGDVSNYDKGITVLSIADRQVRTVWLFSQEDWGQASSEGGMSICWLDSSTILFSSAQNGAPAIRAYDTASGSCSIWEPNAFNPEALGDGRYVSYMRQEGFGSQNTTARTVVRDLSSGSYFEAEPARVVWGSHNGRPYAVFTAADFVRLFRVDERGLAQVGEANIVGLPFLIRFAGDRVDLDELVVRDMAVSASPRALALPQTGR